MNNTNSAKPPLSVFKRCVRWILRTLGAVLAVILTYMVIVLIGLIPVNNSFQPTPGGVEIFIISSNVHADFVLPMTNETANWREFFGDARFNRDVTSATHVAIGWGDKGFFLDTPTWADLKVSTALKALFWPTDSCLHVVFDVAPTPSADVRSVTISTEQYARLVEYIQAKFKLDRDRHATQIAGAAYATNDAFFEAVGGYHCLNTCNSWIGRGMQQTGIRTAWLTPLPRTVFLYLPGGK